MDTAEAIAKNLDPDGKYQGIPTNVLFRLKDFFPEKNTDESIP